MELKVASAIAPIIFDSIIKPNFFTKQIWRMIALNDRSIPISRLEEWMGIVLLCFGLMISMMKKTYTGSLKNGEARNPGIKEMEYLYHYMETQTYWIKGLI